MNNLIKRIAVLERQFNPDPMLVVADTASGEAVMTADECIKSGLGFSRVYSGGNLRDLDKILNYIKTYGGQDNVIE